MPYPRIILRSVSRNMKTIFRLHVYLIFVGHIFPPNEAVRLIILLWDGRRNQYI